MISNRIKPCIIKAKHITGMTYLHGSQINNLVAGDLSYIFLDKIDVLVVVLGGGVANATALNGFEDLKIESNGLYPFAIDGGREDKGVRL